MKRLTAVLLALLLVLAAPLAQAEGTVTYTLTMQVGQEGMAELLMQLGQSREEARENAEIIAGLLDILDLRVTCGPESSRLSLRMGDTDIVEASVETIGGNEMLLRSSLIPGYALHAADTQQDGQTEAQYEAMLEKSDAALSEWLDATKTGTETGAFVGDAYTGGLTRVTYDFDDKLLSGLLDRLAEAMQLPDSLQDVTRAVARANAYSYRLHVVSDAERVIGASFNVLDGEGQTLSTLSLGWNAGLDELHAVHGYGRDGHTYLDDYQLLYGEKDGSLAFKTSVSQMVDDEALGFAAASRMPELTLVEAAAAGVVGGADENGARDWTFIAQMATAKRGASVLNARGTLDETRQTFTMNAELYAGHSLESGSSALTLTVTAEESEPLALGAPGEQIREYDSIGTDEALNKVIETESTRILVRLMRVMPTELLMKILYP